MKIKRFNEGFKNYTEKSDEENERILRKKYEDRLKSSSKVEYLLKIAYLPVNKYSRYKPIGKDETKLESKEYSIKDLTDKNIINHIKDVNKYFGEAKYLYIIEKTITTSNKISSNLLNEYLVKIDADKYNL